MKKFLLLTLAILGCAFASSAYTAQDIAEYPNAYGLLNYPDVNIPFYQNGNNLINNVPNLSESGYQVIYDSENNTLDFGGFAHSNDRYNLGTTLSFTVSGSTAKFGNGAWKVMLWDAGTYRWATATAVGYILSYDENRNWGLFMQLPVGYDNNGDVSATITKLADGNFEITNPNRFKIFEFSEEYYAGAYRLQLSSTNVFEYGGFKLRTYAPNSNMTFHSKITDDYGNVIENDENEPIVFTHDRANQTFTVGNFAGYGITYQLLAPTSKYGNWNYRESKFEGKYDIESLSVQIKPIENFTYFNEVPLSMAQYYVSGGYEGDGNFWSIDGDIKYETLRHKKVHNMWLKPSTQSVTILENPYFLFPYWNEVMLDEYDNPTIVTEATNTRINLDGDLEYTHDAGMQIDLAGYGLNNGNEAAGKYIYVTGEIQQLKNNLLVDPDKYDIYIVPHTGAPDFTHQNFYHENGHINGTQINLSKYFYHWKPETDAATMSLKANALDPVAQGEANNSGLKFCLMVPESELTAKSADGKYALYVRAKYQDGLNLEDSFHAYTVIDPTLSGINDIDGEVAAGIEAINGKIVITGSEGAAMVTNAAGAVIYQGGDTTLDVAPGLYIVRAGKTVKKLLVK